VAALVLTGGIWWVLDWRGDLALGSAWRQAGSYLLMAHGGASMLVLLVLGMLIPLHVRPGWASGNSRTSGVLMLIVNAVLIVTAFGLYYVGHETLRRWTGTLHATIGFGLPMLLAAHVLLGRRRRVEERDLAPSHHPSLARHRAHRRGREGRRVVTGSSRPSH
jgi:hypothetical protein